MFRTLCIFPNVDWFWLPYSVEVQLYFFLHVCFARVILCKGAKAPLQPCGMFTHLFGSAFSTFLVENAWGGCRGTALPSPCINRIPPWLDGFTEVKTACLRRKKHKTFSKKDCLNFKCHDKSKVNPRWWIKSTCWTHEVLDYVGFGTMQLRFTIFSKLFHSVQFLTIRRSQRRIRSPSYKTSTISVIFKTKQIYTLLC